VDDLRFGSIIRLARIKLGWRQQDLAERASVSRTMVSRIERGLLDGVPLLAIRAVARPLGIRVELLPRSRSGDVDRLVHARHGALAEAAIAWLGTFPGWEVRPEVSYSWYGERGVVDLVGWNAAGRAVLLVELKTDVIDVGEVHATMDRRHRLAERIVAPLGWKPEMVGSLLLIGDSDANRDRVAAHGNLFAAALPDRIVRVRAWLRQPAGELRGLAFFANAHPGHATSGFATPRRVRRPREGDSRR
jgi:transcriptional regulator with XRE-family HTH domain